MFSQDKNLSPQIAFKGKPRQLNCRIYKMPCQEVRHNYCQYRQHFHFASTGIFFVIHGLPPHVHIQLGRFVATKAMGWLHFCSWVEFLTLQN